MSVFFNGESAPKQSARSGRNIDTFDGACLIHQAEVFAMAGKLDQAARAITQADPVIRVGAPWALGDAYRLMGDVQLARGETDEAEQSYQHAYQHGWDPYPGFAVLLHQRGRADEVVRALKRAAAQSNWVAAERRSRYLAHAAQIAALSGSLDDVRALLEALDRGPEVWQSSAVAGQVGCARAEVSWAEGRQEEALSLFQSAIDVLHRKRAVMEAALVRLRLAQVLASRGGQQGAAEMELGAAERVFAAAGATGYLAQCRALRAPVTAPPAA